MSTGHVMSEHGMQYIVKFVQDCYTLIIHFWGLVGFKLKSEPLSVYSFSGCFFLSLFISWSFSATHSFQLSCPKSHGLFSPRPSFSVSLSTPMQRSLPCSPASFFFSLFFAPLSPGNQTSGEECWVSTFPEKRTIWATQRPTMDPLCSLLPPHSCTHIHRNWNI